MNSLDGLTEALRVRSQDLERTSDNSAFLSLWQTTQIWLEEMAKSGKIDSLLDGPAGNHYRGFFAPFQRRYLSLAESAVARRLTVPSDNASYVVAQVFDDPFARATYSRVEEVMDLVDFSKCRHLVNVGCGPFPAAALLLHDRSPIPMIVALDSDSEAVHLASAVLRRVGSDRLAAIHADGTQYDYAAADVIYVANQVVPKDAALRRIATTARPGTIVVVREPCGMGRMLADAACEQTPTGFEFMRDGAEDQAFHSRHVFLRVTHN
jgi:protein-L-isoaspartate O-methyltransferase